MDAGRPFEVTECRGEVTVLQGYDQVEDAAPAPQPVVVSQIMDIVDTKTRSTFLA